MLTTVFTNLTVHFIQHIKPSTLIRVVENFSVKFEQKMTATVNNSIQNNTHNYNNDSISTIQLTAQQLKLQLQSQLNRLQYNKQQRIQLATQYNELKQAHTNVCHSDIVLKHAKYSFLQQYKSILPQYEQQCKTQKFTVLQQLHTQLQPYETIDNIDNNDSVEHMNELINEYRRKLQHYTAKAQQSQQLASILQNTNAIQRPHTANNKKLTELPSVHSDVNSDRPRTAEPVKLSQMNTLQAVHPDNTSLLDITQNLDTHADVDDHLSVLNDWLQRRTQREQIENQQLANELAKQRTALLHDIDIHSVQLDTSVADTQSATAQTNNIGITITSSTNNATTANIDTAPKTVHTAESSSPNNSMPPPHPVKLHSLLTHKPATATVTPMTLSHMSMDETQYNTQDLSLDNTSYFAVTPERHTPKSTEHKEVDTAAAQSSVQPVASPVSEPTTVIATPTTQSIENATTFQSDNNTQEHELPPLIQPNDNDNNDIHTNEYTEGAISPSSRNSTTEVEIQPVSPISTLRNSRNKSLPSVPTQPPNEILTTQSATPSGVSKSLPTVPATTTPRHTPSNSEILTVQTTTPTSNNKPLPAIPKPTAPARQTSIHNTTSHHSIQHATSESDDDTSMSSDNIFGQNNMFNYLGGNKRATSVPNNTHSSIPHSKPNTVLQNKQTAAPVVQRAQSVKTQPTVQHSIKVSTTRSHNTTPTKHKVSPQKQPAKPRRTLSGRLLEFLGTSKNRENVTPRQLSSDSSYDDVQTTSKQSTRESKRTSPVKPTYKPNTAAILGINTAAISNATTNTLPEDDEFDF